MFTRRYQEEGGKDITKVSVIIPVYNAEKYLCECLDSIARQTLQGIEIICINDGSTDDSLKILRKYEVNDSRIHVFSQENKGAGPAKNYGLSNAEGEYICFMDSDDFYPDEDILETLYNKAVQNKVFICGGSLCEYHNGNFVNEFEDSFEKYVFQNAGIFQFQEYQFDYGYTRFIYKREFLKKHGICFPDYRRFEDPPFFVKAMIKAGVFYAMPKITYCYRSEHKEIVFDHSTRCLYGIIHPRAIRGSASKQSKAEQ